MFWTAKKRPEARVYVGDCREILPRIPELKAGTLDMASRASILRRLMDVGRRLDEALLGYRIAHARWTRQTSYR